MATGSVLASTAGYAHATADAHGVAANSPGVASGNAVQVPVELPVNACGNTINVIGLLNPAYGNNCANHSGSGTAGTGGSGSHSGSTGSHTGGSGSHTGSTGSHTGGPGSTGSGATGTSGTGASASGTASHSPGVISGNQAQAPVDVPVNACGNSVNVVGLGNPAFGNNCGNHVTPPVAPPTPVTETPPPACTPPNGECTPPGGGTPPPVTPPVTPPGTEHTSTPAAPHGGEVKATAGNTGQQLASTGASGLEILAPAGILLLLGGGVLYRRSRVLARR
ncbi:chaplin [Kitasatospora sp. NPDC059673]|uniref:chaplin n=1 Tax=Kitasatospora sp. NPDC059673 TaxID=3346901 RepID=UPI00369B9D51